MASVPSLIKRVSSRKLLKESERDVREFFRKPRKAIAAAIFFAMLGRAVWFYVAEERMVSELMDAFDKGHDHRLTADELVSLLKANGVDLSNDQVRVLFGRVDEEGDGFDEEEMSRVVNMVSVLPTVSQRVRTVARARTSMVVDILLCLVAGVGLAYLVAQSDKVEKKWAASAFRSAVHFRRMQNQCTKLDKQLAEILGEREKLEEEMKEVERASFAEEGKRQQELQRLSSRLKEVQAKEEEARRALEVEVAKWQAEAEKCMRETTLAKSKMERVMACIKGIDAFTGAGAGSFAQHGAQQGFSNVHSTRGFSLDTICFGTIDNGHLMMYETAHTRKLGEGRDCAYRATDLSTGRELALKMYKMTNPSQRHSIYNDLFAYRERFGRHPRIVSYERVIESADTIFVLMELLAGQDLFDIVATRGLSEAEAKALFRELVEALEHLHKNHVIHCDIKPENAMVVGSIDDNTAHVKLIDFGCSCFTKYAATGQQGSTQSVIYDAYIPPEHAARASLAPAVATDMWRLGCTLFIMLLRRPPFNDDANTAQGRILRETAQFYRGSEYDNLSKEARDLVEHLLVGDPAKRLTAAQVLEHPWLTGTPAST